MIWKTEEKLNLSYYSERARKSDSLRLFFKNCFFTEIDIKKLSESQGTLFKEFLKEFSIEMTMSYAY